jgi:hypothetical protein
MKRRLRVILFLASDRICACAGAGSDEGVRRPRLFEVGHLVGELGWKLRARPEPLTRHPTTG